MRLAVHLLLLYALAAPALAEPPAASLAQAGGGAALEVVPLDDEADAHAPGGLEIEEPPSGYPDPLEDTNRGVLRFDQHVDRWVVSPIIATYQFIVPPPARRAVRRFCLNLNSFSILTNDLLQREWRDAAVTSERFLLNSTLGIGGLFDPAAAIGMERHTSDFSQTLALAGVDSGPYLIMPLFGPSTVRDAGGDVVDFFMQPTLYFLPIATLFIYEGSLGLGSGLAARDYHSEGLESLRASSVDFYSALRNAYYQTRTAEIWDRRDAHRPVDD